MPAGIDPLTAGIALAALAVGGVLLALARLRRLRQQSLHPRDPKLVAVGFGGNLLRNLLPDPNLVVTTVTIRNQPRTGRSKGLRDPASDCTARLYDPEQKKYLGNSLQWRNPESGTFQDRMSLAPGEHADLCLFVNREYSHDYFVFLALSTPAPVLDQLTWVPPDRRRFEVHITDGQGITHVIETRVGRRRGNAIDIRFPPNAGVRRVRDMVAT